MIKLQNSNNSYPQIYVEFDLEAACYLRSFFCPRVQFMEIADIFSTGFIFIFNLVI